jgi:3-oxoacyl-[acyl-carrier protein] reductase
MEVSTMSSSVPVVLITGASRGLGRGIAVELSKRGCSVAVNYLENIGAANDTVSLCEKSRTNDRQRFVPLHGDVGKERDRERLFQDTLKTFSRIDALVNNAGILPRVRNDILETSHESFAEVLGVNLEGPFFLTQRVAKYWLNEKPIPAFPRGFKVVFNSSISANTASLNRPEYCISKAGLSMVAQLWAVRLAASGILVYELRPGIMETDMSKGAKEKYDRLLSEGIAPQLRWGQPQDVGLAVAALLFGDFPYSTGEVIYIDGGFHLLRL